MSYDVICPNCGKLLILIPEDSGRQVLCGACGALLQAPVFASTGGSGSRNEPSPGEAGDGHLPPLQLPGLGLPPAPPKQAKAPQPPAPQADAVPEPVSGRLRGPWLWGLVAAVALVGMMLGGGLAVLLVSSPRNPPPLQARQDPPQGMAARSAEAETPAPVADRREPADSQKAPEPETAVQPPAPAIPTPQPRLAPPAIRPAVAVAVPASQPSPERPRRVAGMTDQQIEQAIRGGVEYLLWHFDNPANWREVSNQLDVGINCLCIYALQQCGQTLPDERLNSNGQLMRDLLAAMRQYPMGGYEGTYARSLRATALAQHNRPEDRAVLRADVVQLLKAASDGAYGYGDQQGNLDNSNSQYGLLGVWAGAELGLEVPQIYWKQVRKHWIDCQHPSGVWGYRPGAYDDPSLSMTVAGLASLLVTHDYLESPAFGREVGRDPYPEPIARALGWLEQDDHCMEVEGKYPGYTLYGLERVALASGFKYFGTHEWYPELAQWVTSRQIPFSFTRAGKEIACVYWRGTNYGKSELSNNLVETAFSLLFLARGRHPILMNKLRFDGNWANRPRDVANLTRFASKELERPLNWQVVPLNREWYDWMDSPILYIASHRWLKFTDEECAKLRKYVEGGGLIFTQADGESEPLGLSVEELGKKLFPAYEWKDLPRDHPIYNLHYKVQDPPPLRYLSNGVRILMLHSPKDLAQAWQVRAERTRRSAHELGVNLFIYAVGKADLRHRLSSPYLPEPPEEPKRRIPLARLRYSGAWNPEPYAFMRFSRWLGYETGWRIDPTTVGLEFLKSDAWPVAHLTGAARYELPEAEIGALRRYVEDGGVLLIDACGGSNDFDQSTQAMLRHAFPQSQLRPIPVDHPVLSGKGNLMIALPKPEFRPSVSGGDWSLQILSSGKGHVIYSALDLTWGLLGMNTWGVRGYQPTYAQNLVRNVVLWAADRPKHGVVESAKPLSDLPAAR
ncbi:MAG: DUF4159 domain-containing protein [Bacillota bacterium]